jgi:hypothetical protein
MSAFRIEQRTEMAKYSEELLMVSVVMGFSIFMYVIISCICWVFTWLSDNIRSSDDIV